MKSLMEFLDRYDIEYRVEGDRVVVDGDVRLSGKRIEELPDSIVRLKCDYLSLPNNNLKSLPESIGDLEIVELFLSGNKLESLPESIGSLKCKLLSLSNNQLKSLPDSFGRLECDHLSLRDNPLEPCLHLFKDWDDSTELRLNGTSMYKEDVKTVGDYRKEIDLAYELRKPDNAGIMSMFDMGLF